CKNGALPFLKRSTITGPVLCWATPKRDSLISLRLMPGWLAAGPRCAQSFGLNSPLAFEQRVAAKTGTSSGFRDAWTVGFDREHTAAVWAGNFDGRPMRDTFAVRAATPLWAAVMRELLRRDHPLDPPGENQGLVHREICKATGLLPSRFSPATL